MRQEKNRTRTSGGDVSALLLRLSIGPMMVAHGWNKLRGPGGIEGTTGWFKSLGLRPAWLHARLAAGTEIGAGSLLTLGALNPLPSAAVIGLMAVAGSTDHRGKGLFIFKGGWEYVAVVGAAATALAGLGHGRFSVDHLAGTDRAGTKWALGAAGLGVANAAIVLATSYRPPAPAS